MDLQKQSKKYLEAQIKTANKEQLLLMLYDGAIRFCQQAEKHIEDGNREESCALLIKSQNIVAELISSLQFDKNKDVSKNLAALYGYVYIQLMEANTKMDISKIHNSLKILQDLRNTWCEAFEKVGLNCEGKPSAQTTANQEVTDNKPAGGLSIQA